MSDSPAYQAAQYAYETYRQRRIAIASAYSRQCDANSDRLVEDLTDIALRYGPVPEGEGVAEFGNARPDFIGRVRRAISASKPRNKVIGG